MRMLLVMLLLVVPCVASASNWKVIRIEDRETTGNLPGPMYNKDGHWPLSIMVDTDSIVTDGDLKRVWSKKLVSTPGLFMDMMSLDTYDCRNYRFTPEKSAYRVKPTVPYEWTYTPGLKPLSLFPDSDEDRIFAAVCKDNWKQD